MQIPPFQKCGFKAGMRQNLYFIYHAHRAQIKKLFFMHLKELGIDKDVIIILNEKNFKKEIINWIKKFKSDLIRDVIFE